jgi:hypothetical protein
MIGTLPRRLTHRQYVRQRKHTGHLDTALDRLWHVIYRPLVMVAAISLLEMLCLFLWHRNIAQLGSHNVHEGSSLHTGCRPQLSLSRHTQSSPSGSWSFFHTLCFTGRCPKSWLQLTSLGTLLQLELFN